MPARTEQTTFTFGSWNVLRDGLHSIGVNQPDRLAAITAMLVETGPFDVMGLYEVHGSLDDHPGEGIAKELGAAGHAFAPYDNWGMVLTASEQFPEIETLNLDPDQEGRVALIARGAGGAAVAATHTSHYPITGGKLRKRQTEKLLHALSDAEWAVITGDLNALPWQASRRMLEDHGFVSVFDSFNIPHPATYPADAATSDIGVPRVVRPFVRQAFRIRQLPLDGMYIRGAHEVLYAGIIKANPIKNGHRGRPEHQILSDHHGITATIKRTG